MFFEFRFEFIGIRGMFIGDWISIKIDKGIPILKSMEKKISIF